MVIVFDLDDTLYDEVTFVKSGYKAVAEYLSTLLGYSQDTIYDELFNEFLKDRNKVFDRFLEKHGKNSKTLVMRCLSIYRKHNPSILLYSEANRCLDRLKKYPLYVVTDGNSLVQRKKFYALNLKERIKRCLCTYSFGKHYSKPSPYCFKRICQLEKVEPNQVVYVSDNPYKDFVGIKPLGFHTVRVLKGPYKNIHLDSAYEAEISINSLDELTIDQLNKLVG